MYKVYILKSQTTGKYYIGSTNNLEKRITSHNLGLSRWTKSGIPWIIVHVEVYQTRSTAILREKKIKSYKNGNEFKKLLIHS